ncbi:MAG: hypothetical protein EHM12_11090 [Dehalococcoidia bacterium]|nr:MAG: hypothetical protein EHM12_11090 [Dehalococcoidia bacterium]
MDNWLWVIFTLIFGNYAFTFMLWCKQQSNFNKLMDQLTEIKLSNKATEVNITNINEKLHSISQTVIKDKAVI